MFGGWRHGDIARWRDEHRQAGEEDTLLVVLEPADDGRCLVVDARAAVDAHTHGGIAPSFLTRLDYLQHA